MRGLLMTCCLLAACSGPTELEELKITWEVPSSIRALEVVSESEVWYAGSNGRIGVTRDGGKSWQHDSLRLTDGTAPALRSLAVTSRAAHALTIASPAVLFRSTDYGAHWDSVYTEHHEDVFYDSMAFWDDEEGIAMGDAIDGCLSILMTRDGGLTWVKKRCDELPPSIPGEAAFAASNGNIALAGDQVWIATGGKASRIFHSSDRGQSWDVYPTPIVQGGTMTGMFSIAMCDANRGVGWGGNWEAMEDNTANKVTSSDGGRSWSLFSPNEGPGYRSCIRYLPGSNCQGIWAVGTPGISQSTDAGQTWHTEADSSFFTVRFTPSGMHAWLAGRGIIQRRRVNS